MCHGLLAAQEPPATETPSTTEPTTSDTSANDTPPPATPAAAGETAIIGPIADGTPSPPAPEPQLPDFRVKRTLVKRVMREEPSGVPDLKPVRKLVTATMQLVEDPHLPAPPPPPPPLDINDPAVLAWKAKVGALYQKTEFVFVSATVYDHQRTLLRWWPNRDPDAEMTMKLAPVPVLGRWPNGDPLVEVTAWSNIDFNHLCGFSDYTYNGRRYSLVMGVGNQNTDTMEKWAQRSGRVYSPPEFPDLPADGPGFVVTKGDTSDTHAMEIMTGLHELYKVEGARMKAAYEAREQASIEREAYLRANPPQPQDVVIRFWRRDTAARPQPAVQPPNTNPENSP